MLQLHSNITTESMELITSVNQSQILYDKSTKIIKMYFKGDMSDDEYKAFWTKSIDFGEKHRLNRIIIDQREIGNVSFNARGWVVISAFPRVKKVLPNNLVAGILSSERVVQKTGMQYLLKAFRTITGYKVEVFPSDKDAIVFLQSANTIVESPADRS